MVFGRIHQGGKVQACTIDRLLLGHRLPCQGRKTQRPAQDHPQPNSQTLIGLQSGQKGNFAGADPFHTETHEHLFFVLLRAQSYYGQVAGGSNWDVEGSSMQPREDRQLNPRSPRNLRGGQPYAAEWAIACQRALCLPSARDRPTRPQEAGGGTLIRHRHPRSKHRDPVPPPFTRTGLHVILDLSCSLQNVPMHSLPVLVRVHRFGISFLGSTTGSLPPSDTVHLGCHLHEPSTRCHVSVAGRPSRLPVSPSRIGPNPGTSLASILSMSHEMISRFLPLRFEISTGTARSKELPSLGPRSLRFPLPIDRDAEPRR